MLYAHYFFLLALTKGKKHFKLIGLFLKNVDSFIDLSKADS